jgi:hypothetical protein
MRSIVTLGAKSKIQELFFPNGPWFPPPTPSLRDGTTTGLVYSPMRSAITSICRPKNPALATISSINYDPEISWVDILDV